MAARGGGRRRAGAAGVAPVEDDRVLDDVPLLGRGFRDALGGYDGALERRKGAVSVLMECIGEGRSASCTLQPGVGCGLQISPRAALLLLEQRKFWLGD